ncbi:MAG: twitching motility protein PilJ [Gammaproteobacteria bacterium]|jgi:twitching motility protein PilJ
MALLGNKKNLFPTENKGAEKDKSINKKVAFIGLAIVVSILVMTVLFSIKTLLSGQNKDYTALISEQQIVSYQISLSTLSTLESIEGDGLVFDELAASKRRFIAIFNQFDNSLDALTWSPLSTDYKIEYSKLKDVWRRYDSEIDTVISAKVLINTVSQDVAVIRESLPELILLAETVIDELVKANTPRQNIATAAHQLGLVRGLDNRIQQILTGGSKVMDAAEQFSSDSELIEKQLLAMLEGNLSLAINQFTDARVVDNLLQFADLYSVVKKNVQQILEYSPELSKVHAATQNIQSLSEEVRITSKKLLGVIDTKGRQFQILTFVGYAIGVVALLLLASLASIIVRQSRSRLVDSQSQNNSNQRAISRLLDEMTNLADGDLSTHTTVTEDITGAIADSVNYSIDALRDLVGTINKTAVQVSDSVRKTHLTTRRLEVASNEQAAQIASASASITDISKSMLSVSEKATDSAEVARNSVNIAHTGSQTVKHTIDGMETIRQQIQETSKRIKRLGESSQEIGDIVNLITEISDQTNILALNAAIQAAMAGEAGRGFAVVADEVQRLAERTGDATKQIEALVKTIQADTKEAAMSMERSTANVVKGAKLTEDAGSALDKIEQVSMNLAQRILEISDATKSQASESIKITQTMDDIEQITLKTAEGSIEATGSIGELSEMVAAMHDSVAGFKLPDGGSLDNTAVYNADELATQNLTNQNLDHLNG